MSIIFTVDARDEKLQGATSWFSPEDAACGVTVHLESTKIHFTAAQLEAIYDYWERNQIEVKDNLCKHILGNKEKEPIDAVQTN